MQQYLDHLTHILQCGDRVATRAVLKSTGRPVEAISVLGYQNRYDLRVGFPAVTTKKLFWKGVVAELLWFLDGDTKAKTLQDQGVHIWDGWVKDKETTDCGPIYSQQWRAWEAPLSEVDLRIMFDRAKEDAPDEYGLGSFFTYALKHRTHKVDQIANLLAGIEAVKADPNASIGRRLIVTAWNPADIDRMGLPACHSLFQMTVRNGGLYCHMYQRSADMLLGVPFNIANYALLTHMVAQVTGLEAREFIHTFHDSHVYSNHMEQVTEQLSREPRPLPTLRLNPSIKRLGDFKLGDIELVGYDPHPAIKAEVAI